MRQSPNTNANESETSPSQNSENVLTPNSSPRLDLHPSALAYHILELNYDSYQFLSMLSMLSLCFWVNKARDLASLLKLSHTLWTS